MNRIFTAVIISMLLFGAPGMLFAQDGPDDGEKTATKTETGDKKAESTPVGKRSVAQLRADLDSGEPARQNEAARELGKRKTVEAIPDLVGLVAEAPTASVRRNSAAALGLIKKAGPATEALLRAAREDKDATVRYAALVALANIQDKDKAQETLDLMKWTRSSSSDEFAKDLVSRLLAKLEKAESKKEEPKSDAPADSKKS